MKPKSGYTSTNTGTTSMGVQYELDAKPSHKRKGLPTILSRWPARRRKQAAKAALYALVVTCAAALSAVVGDVFWPEAQTAAIAPTIVPTQTLESTAAAVPTPMSTAAGALVWIPASGSRYHANAQCSNMHDPREAPLTEAVSLGLTPCQRCHPPS